MTSDGISTKDWDVVKDFAAKIANAICGNKDLASHNLTMDLFRYLEIIEKKYGTLPSILATRADYIRETSKRVKLLEQAWGLAKKMSDKANLVLVSSSLAEFFIEELGKAPEGKKWPHPTSLCFDSCRA